MPARIFHKKKKSAFRRFGWPALALTAAVGLGWFATAMVAPLRPARAGAPVEGRDHLTYHGALRHGGIPVEQLRNAARRLESAAVRNSHGDPVGVVSSVTVGPGGRPERVDIAFGGIFGIGASIVPVAADKLGYDPTRHLVLTDMTVSELAVIAQHRQARAEETASAD